ncbi:hypothetical protein J5J86_15465 [Aquabacter sp. L1I39]|uniref:hypothetical protein n=1 Tax=Aquabacter sp. L1I39 TaxID=2820278 RepID=UPI001ADCB362|nr:hypothetical protein [Aquabacter sp. L1I39]QTL02192.1 hypothetical protein J5J86_15465 [Aquabacter sp. L1I39]
MSLYLNEEAEFNQYVGHTHTVRLNEKERVNRYRGRKPTFSSEQLIAAQEMLSAGKGVSNVARESAIPSD